MATRLDLTPFQLSDGMVAGFTSLGSYPIIFITDDGGVLCPSCVNEERERINESDEGDGWFIVAADVNYESANCVCDNCGKYIDPAYITGDELVAARAGSL